MPYRFAYLSVVRLKPIPDSDLQFLVVLFYKYLEMTRSFYKYRWSVTGETGYMFLLSRWGKLIKRFQMLPICCGGNEMCISSSNVIVNFSNVVEIIVEKLLCSGCNSGSL